MCHTFAKENIELFSKQIKNFLLFLGLNSLSNSEQFIVNYLLENNTTNIFGIVMNHLCQEMNMKLGIF